MIIKGRHAKHNRAVTPVLSALLAIMIVISVISGILLWGIPYMNQLEAEMMHENMYSQLSFISDSLKNMIYEDTGAKRGYNIDATKGSINIDSAGDRLILSYSLDSNPNYNFTVTELDDEDNLFSINTNADLDKINIYWFRDPVLHSPVCEDLTLVDQTGNACSFIKFDISSIYNLADLKSIDIISAKLRLFLPENSILDEEFENIDIAHVQSQEWSQNWELDELKKIIHTEKRGNTLIVPREKYIEADIYDIFLKEYNSKNNFCSISIENINHPMNQPEDIINKNLLYTGNIADYILFYSKENDVALSPELIIHYVELNETDSNQKKDNNKEEVIIDNIYNSPEKSRITTNIGCMITENPYEYYTDNVKLKTYFREISSKTCIDPIAIVNNGYILTSTPSDYLTYISDDSLELVEHCILKQEGKAKIADNIITYRSQYGTGIDLRYICSDDIVKEELIIDNPIRLKEPSNKDVNLAFGHHIKAYSMDTEKSLGICYGEKKTIIKKYGLFEDKAITTDEEIFFTDSNGKVVFCLPKLYAYDSKTPTCNKIRLKRVVNIDNSGDITTWILTPWSWLSNKNRVYPIFIDPSVTYQWSSTSPPVTTAKYCYSGANPPLDISEKYLPYTTMQEDNLLSDGRNIWNAGNSYMNLIYSVDLDLSSNGLPYNPPMVPLTYLEVTWNGHNDGYDWDWYPSNADLRLYLLNWHDSSSSDDWKWEQLASTSESNSDIDLQIKLSTYREGVNITKYIYSNGVADKLMIGFMAKTRACFHENTSISIADGGNKLIKNIVPGDNVLSYDENTGEIKSAYVTKNIYHNPNETSEYYLIINNALCVTLNHPLFVNGKWQPAHKVKIDDVLIGENGLKKPVKSIKKIFNQIPTYDLEVEPYHTYFAEGILVHNKPTYSVSEDTLKVRAVIDYASPTVNILGAPDLGDSSSSSHGFYWGGGDTESPIYGFSYILEGYSSKWSTWTPAHKKKFYDLPDGSYTFKVKSMDESGWMSPEASTTFSIIGGYTEKVSFDKSGGLIDDTNKPEFKITVPPGSPAISGSLRIDLRDNTGFLFGRIFLFDLGAIEYNLPSSSGTLKNIIETNGILSVETDKEYLKKEPFITSEHISSSEDMLSCRIVQIKNMADYATSGNGQVKLFASLEENRVREMLTDVYNFKIQISGPYLGIWRSYFSKAHGFVLSSDGQNNLLHPQMDDKTILQLTHSICEVGLQ